ncbi:MAG TPA: DNA mismatch repair protein MutS [Myxococcaceae bacterium]|nr:DNA mismatch repair protein MutS [Myxococcaceae bacterium]
MNAHSHAEAYRGRLSAARQGLARLDRLGSWLANFRGGTFLGALVAAGVTVYGRLPRGDGWALAAAFLASYVGLAVWHQRVIAEEERYRLRVSLNERGLARMEGGWHAFPNTGQRFLEADHLYAADLDVFGQGSLFQLIDESGTQWGERRLAAWLAAPAAAAVVRARQRAVAELSGLLDFRQELIVESRLASKEKADPGRFIAWAEGPALLRSIRWSQPVAWALPLAFLVTAALAVEDRVPAQVPWGLFFALVAMAVATRGPLNRLYEALASSEGGFVRFENAFARVERTRFEDGTLRQLGAALGAEASRALASFSRRFGFAELRQSSQLHAAVHILTLWDVHWFFALERWRVRYGARVRQWFDALAELEALGSVAGLAHARPEFCVPDVSEGGGPALRATRLGHPLLQAPVCNDVALTGPGTALIITGSNMSGKTTFLRTLGVNAVLALAGAPVCATSFQCSVRSVLTGMRVKDSLERGVSYFYAEVQRIKALLDAARAAGGQALFLLDEILLGTNARERQLASKEILRLLIETGAIGAVATHYLTLSSVADGMAERLHNLHFEDHVVDGQMRFDYLLKDGVVRGTNALRMLRDAGIDVRESGG